MELVPGRKENTEEILHHLLIALRPIVDKAIGGDATSEELVREVHKLVRPDLYRLPPRVARAMEFYRLMGKLSRVVAPINGSSLLSGKSYVKLTESKERKRFREYALAKQHMSRRQKPFTLQSLAISIFIEQADSKGLSGINKRTIEEDLRLARLYHAEQKRLRRAPDYYMVLSNGESLPFYNYSEDWKRRKTYTAK